LSPRMTHSLMKKHCFSLASMCPWPQMYFHVIVLGKNGFPNKMVKPHNIEMLEWNITI
jgi:hypothetical protein